jgi:O-antigen/teichoic acid export membrane protein
MELLYKILKYDRAFISISKSAVILLSGILLTYLLNVYIARLLSLSDFGAYSILMSLSMVVGTAARMGMDTSSLKMIPVYLAKKLPGNILKYIKFSDKLVLLSSLLLVFCTSFFLMKELSLSYFFVFFVLLGIVLPMALSALRQAQQRSMGNVVFAYFPEKIIKPLLIFFSLFAMSFLSIDINFSMVSISLCFAFVVVLIIDQSLCSKVLLRLNKNTGEKKIKFNWLSESAPLMVISLAQVLMTNMDILLLAFLLGNESVAIYSVASRVAMLIGFPLVAANSIIPSKIAKLYEKNEYEKLNAFLKQIVFKISIVSLVGLIIFLFLGGYVLSMFGELYVDAYPLLLILAFGQFINVLLGPVGFLLNMTGYQNITVKVILYIIFFGFILSYFFISFFGVYGAAFSTATIMIFWNTVLAIFAKKKTGICSTFLCVGNIMSKGK